MSYAKNIRELRLRENLSQEDFGRIAGVSGKAVSTWENEMKIPRMGSIQKIADYFGIKKSDLLSDDPIKSIPSGFLPPPETVRVPLVGRIACGDPILAEENIEEYIDAPAGKHIDFCLECHGESMIDIGLQDGDIAYIRKQPIVENGQIAAVRIGDEATLKRVYRDAGTLTLMPANSAYAPRVFTGEQINDVCIEGKMVGFTHWV